jgi:FMN phosphatase YigB (HAD superfamily)
MKTKLILLSDIDGVVVDWFDGYREYLSTMLGIESTNKMPTTFGMTDVYPQLEKPWEFIQEYQTSPQYMNLKLFPDVKSTLTKLREIGVEVHFVTSCGTQPQTINMRNEWLSYYLEGLYKDVHFLNLGEDKFRVLKQFANSDLPVIFIDDQEKMLQAAVDLGYTAVLKDMEYNQNTKLYQRVYNYRDLIEIVENEISTQKKVA